MANKSDGSFSEHPGHGSPSKTVAGFQPTKNNNYNLKQAPGDLGSVHSYVVRGDSK